MPDKDDSFLKRLAALEPKARKQDASAARTRIRSIFEDLTAARDRGVTWVQIADLMLADGIRAADGEPLTADEVRALYHVERYARGGKRKRRKGSAPVTPPVQSRPTQSSAAASQPVTKPSMPAGRQPLPAMTEEDEPAPTPFQLKPAILKGTQR